ncbi:efflux RND transporter periplasmic adaptor subunit [Thalassotalea fusca]
MKAKKFIPLIVIVSFALLAYIVVSNPPKAQRGRPSQAPQLNVDVISLASENVALTINSYGTVKPRTQSVLLPQVSGEIIRISHTFRDGGFFEKGDILLELDDRDLKAEVKIARSSLYSARQALSEEEARVEQAKQDWIRLGNGGEAPELVLRKPQLLAAKASVSSAEASLTKAELALERSKIIAPYRGRVLSKKVDVGQVVSSGTQLAEIYAVDYIEVRLPIKNKDLPYMLLPESNRFEQESVNEQPAVTLVSDLTGRQEWHGRIVRTEGAFDESSQQLYVVAQIDDPYGKKAENNFPLKIGQYVTANIKGKVVENSIKIPNKTIYQGSYVYVVDNNKLLRKEISIAWQNEKFAIVSSGLLPGENLVLTPLGQVTSGTPVAVNHSNEQPSQSVPADVHPIKKPERGKRLTKEEFAQLPKEEQEKIRAQRAARKQGER